MSRIKIFVLVAGIALLYAGYKQWRLSGVVKAEAQVISCADLARDGYGENAHVKLKDYFISQGGLVYEEKRGSKEWGKVWIPVLPSDGEYAKMYDALPVGAEIPAPRSFGVILQTEQVKSLGGLGALEGRDFLAGVIINEIDSLDGDTKKLLAESYPGVDLDACWILDHRRKATTTGFLSLGLGAGLVLLAVILFLRGRKRSAAEATSHASAEEPVPAPVGSAAAEGSEAPPTPSVP